MFKKILILNIAYLIGSLAGYCDLGDKLTDIEYAKYGESFTYESISDRLNRLETDYFGMAQTGDIDSRINMLSTMSRSSKQIAVQNPYDAYYTGKQKGKLRTFWDNVTSTFDSTGVMTGYTPSMTTNSYNYGYPTNMYRNEFLNFMNNPQSYCPYHNRYHYNNHILNRPYHNNWGMINNQNINNRYYNRIHSPYNNMYNPYWGGQNYNPYFRTPRNMIYTPPNIATRSSVHIIKD